jgi:thymidylate synthase (FAD)
MEAVNVLDHGLVRMVDSMGNDLSISRNARVSYDAAWRAGENEKGDAALINYLLVNGHNTPFESVFATFEIKAPIFVFRQWHRHRTQSYNELSARYRELPEVFYVPELAQVTTQSSDNKQMRTDELNPHAQEYIDSMTEHCERAFELYRQYLKAGIPRELARTVLPLGTYSHMFASANLFNWMRFCKERMEGSAQYEVRVFAEIICDMLCKVAPVAMQAFKDKYKF